MGRKNKARPKGISKVVWLDVNKVSVDKILQSVKDYCAMEDGSIPSDSETFSIRNFAENPFVKLIYASALEEGYSDF